MRSIVVDANSAFYAQQNDDYFVYRSSDAFLAKYRDMFARDWFAIEGHLPSTPAVLDCCAGTGLATRLLNERGCRVTAVDVSDHMLQHLDVPGVTKVCAEIEDFLRAESSQYDLVVFASAVHHLFNYDEVLELALQRVRPGGCMWLIAEPVLQTSRSGRSVRRVEFIWRKLTQSPRDVPAAIGRRLRYWATRRSVSERGAPEQVTGFYAEIHSGGLDWGRIWPVFERNGARVILCETRRSKHLRLLKRLVPGFEGDNRNVVVVR